MGIPDRLNCQEATVRTGYETTDWFQIGKEVCQGCIFSLCLFNVYAEYNMRNAVLEEAKTGIKIAGGNINNLRYADDTTLMGGSLRKTPFFPEGLAAWTPTLELEAGNMGEEGGRL